MASSSKLNLPLGDAGILRKKEDEDELFVFGYSSKLFRDDDKALYIDQGKHLIPWMGDDTLKIDRYDGRGTLYDLKQYEPLPGGYDESLWVGLSDSERHVEHLCNEERYRALHHNEDEEALYQEKPEGRAVRQRRQFHSDPYCCPVCGLTVRPSELPAHLHQEVERLGQLGRQRRGGEPGPPALYPTPRDTFLRVKRNRRLRVKQPRGSQAKCPVCNVSVRGGFEELSRHVDNCLRAQDQEVDVEEWTGPDRYEWAGQERVRAASLLEGGYAGAGMLVGHYAEDDDDLVVDEDDDLPYGPPQYSEADVVPTVAGGPAEEAERTALREAVIQAGVDPSVVGGPAEEAERMDGMDPTALLDAGVGREVYVIPTVAGGPAEEAERTALLNAGVDRLDSVCGASNEPDASSVLSNATCCSGSEVNVQETSQVVKALKSRINELEKAMPAKCLICLGHYVQPVISVNCWHVYCEECWLHSLGAKKLCPQCNTITSPSDLRKIYI